ncbi:HicB family protein [Rhizobium gallicum]|uniref:HicB family protein n=1 Tax=Rhizobium gallicum TaxID=56730 RepID=A0A1L5NG62_9HYPH|nr:HicB family protein [Rhizobium gallicum]
MNDRQRKTVKAIFRDLVPGTIAPGRCREPAYRSRIRGHRRQRFARVRFEKDGQLHPAKDAKRDQIKDACRPSTTISKPAASWAGNRISHIPAKRCCVDPEIHARAATAAELAGKSLNQWAEKPAA